jgi:hypothetical protein
VVAYPGPDPLAGVPRGVVPHQQQGAHPAHGQVVAAPREKLGGECANRLAHGESSPEPLWGVGSARTSSPSHAKACRIRSGPSVHRRLGQAAPPHFIRKAQRPVRVGRR